MIICICRGKSEKDVMRSIENGAKSVRDLQRCGIGDQCGSCHSSLRAILARAAADETAAAAASEAVTPCPSCHAPETVSALAPA